jgi:hypothetical protein
VRAVHQGVGVWDPHVCKGQQQRTCTSCPKPTQMTPLAHH